VRTMPSTSSPSTPSLTTLAPPHALTAAHEALQGALGAHSERTRHNLEHAEKRRAERERDRELKEQIAMATGEPAG
jgi:hypothetical protein